jgi:hypothetical protein
MTQHHKPCMYAFAKLRLQKQEQHANLNLL